MSAYVPILILFVLAAGFCVVTILLNEFLGKRRAGIGKTTTYECGMPIRGGARARFSVHYYLVALLFILFDVETAFLLPWAANARALGANGFAAMAGFLIVLGVGLLYVIRKNALEWDR